MAGEMLTALKADVANFSAEKHFTSAAKAFVKMPNFLQYDGMSSDSTADMSKLLALDLYGVMVTDTSHKMIKTKKAPGSLGPVCDPESPISVYDSNQFAGRSSDNSGLVERLSKVEKKISELTPPSTPCYTPVKPQLSTISSPSMRTADATPFTPFLSSGHSMKSPSKSLSSRPVLQPLAIEPTTPPAYDRIAPSYFPSVVTPDLLQLLSDARNCNLVLPPKTDPSAPLPPASSNILLCFSKTLPHGMSRQFWGLEDYTLLEKLYTGYASTVFKATCKRSGRVVVLKVYTLSAVCELYRYQVYREVRIHSSLEHENVVHLYAAFQEGEKVVLVQEFADGGDLFALIHKNGGRLSERVAVQMVLEPFMRVIQYLHSRGIVHRDIKPENIMLSQNMSLKIGDFGLAIDIREERPVTRAGTLDYMAPEVLKCPFKSRPDENKEKQHVQYNSRVDTWAVGVLAYELIIGFPPFFDQKSRTGTEQRINTCMPSFPSNMCEEARNFISAALAKDPAERPTIHEMLHHPWMAIFANRVSSRNPLSFSHAMHTALSSPASMGSPAATGTHPPSPPTPAQYAAPSGLVTSLSMGDCSLMSPYHSHHMEGTTDFSEHGVLLSGSVPAHQANSHMALPSVPGYISQEQDHMSGNYPMKPSPTKSALASSLTSLIASLKAYPGKALFSVENPSATMLPKGPIVCPAPLSQAQRG